MRQPCLLYLSTSNEAVFLTFGKKFCSHRGAYGVSLYDESSCLSLCRTVREFVAYVFFADGESSTAGKYGLTRGTCFVERRLEVVAVAGLLWISWCVLGGA